MTYVLTLSPDGFAYIALLSVGIFAAAANIVASIKRYGFSAIALRPIVLFSVFFAVIHFIVPLVKYMSGRYRYQLAYEPETLLLNAALCLLLLVFAWILASSSQFSPVPRNGVRDVQALAGGKTAGMLAWPLYLVGAIFAASDAHTILVEIGYLDFMRDLHAASESRSPLRKLANLMIPASTLYLVSLLTSARVARAKWLLLAGLYIPVILYAILLNSRNTFLLLFIVNLSTYLALTFRWRPAPSSAPLKITKASLRSALVVLCTVVVLAGGASKITEIRYGNFESAFMQERRENALFYLFDGAFGNDENLLWLTETSQGDTYFGWTYVAGFLNLVPRAIWPSKPEGAGPLLTNTIRPGAYQEGQEGSNSFTTGLLTEGFMNFGYLGLPLLIVGWAYASSRAVRAFHRTSNVFFRVAFLIAAMSFSSAFLYAEFLGFFGRLFIFVAPLFAVGFVFRFRFRRS